METPSDKQGPSPGRNARGRGPAAPQLAPGTVLANRYEILRAVLPSPFGTVYDAMDREARHPVFVRNLNAELLAKTPQGPQRMKAALDVITRLEHKNLTHTLDLVGAANAVYIVSDHVEGETLRSLIARRRSQGAAGLSLKSAVNALAHVCNALSAAHAVGAIHGSLTSTTVHVNAAGRVKVSDIGLAPALPVFAQLVGDADRCSIAPEVLAGQPFDARADIYSLGAILFELLVGRPATGVAKLAQLLPGLPEELDAIIDRCTATSPDDRPADPQKLKQVLWQLVDARGASASQAMSASAIREIAAETSMPSIRLSAQRLAAAVPRTDPKRPGKEKIDELEEKWLVSKGNLDFGPYSFAQVKELIGRDEIQLGHVLIDNDSGMKVSVEDHPLLHDLVMKAAQRREDARRVNVEMQVVTQAKRHGRAFFALIGVGVLGVAVAAFFVIRAISGKKDASAGTIELSALDKAELKEFKVGGAKRVTGGKKRTGARSGPAGPATDESLAFDMEDDSVGDARLDDSQINGVIAANGGSLARCILDESRRGGSRSADIEFSVAGSGKVTFVRVNGETKSQLARCVWGKMSTWRFPTFNGTRTRASFPINL